MTRHFHVGDRSQAWKEADRIFPTDYTKDERKSDRAGYAVYVSTICDAWISDLGERLEINLPNGDTYMIWIDKPPMSEYMVDDALAVVSETLYQMDDNILPNTMKAFGLDEAREIVYAAYHKAYEYLKKYYPESKLIAKYNLQES